MTFSMWVADDLRREVEDGPDGRNPIPFACPKCEWDLSWQQVVDAQHSSADNYFRIECDRCPFTQEGAL
jgi:hypothetical protein